LIIYERTRTCHSIPLCAVMCYTSKGNRQNVEGQAIGRALATLGETRWRVPAHFIPAKLRGIPQYPRTPAQKSRRRDVREKREERQYDATQLRKALLGYWRTKSVSWCLFSCFFFHCQDHPLVLTLISLFLSVLSCLHNSSRHSSLTSND